MPINAASGSNSNSYRNSDFWTNYFNDEEKKDSDSNKTNGVDWGNTVWADEKDNRVSVDDFLTLMVAQLKNQDFMNPVDDTQYVTQLAQFATMQQMEEMAAYAKQSYVTSLIGKNVTVAKLTVTGDVSKAEGPIEKISLVNNEYKVYVGGKSYTLEEIMQIHQDKEPEKTEEEKAAEAEQKALEEERYRTFNNTLNNINDNLSNINNEVEDLRTKEAAEAAAAGYFGSGNGINLY